MSWLEHSKDSSRFLKGAAVAVIASVLGFGVSGCGFHPMYATTPTGGESQRCYEDCADRAHWQPHGAAFAE